MSLHDMAKMTVMGTPGGGNITLGLAVSGFQSFAASGVGNGEVISYSVADVANAWEVGHGTYSSTGPTLTRTVLFSSNGNAPIAMTSAAVVACTVLAEDLKTIVTGSPFLNAGTVLPGGTIASSTSSLLASSLLLGGGAGAVTSLGSLGTATTVLHGNVSGAPTFGAVALASDVSGRLPLANLSTLSAASLLGNSDTIAASGSNIAIGAGVALSVGTLTGNWRISTVTALGGALTNIGGTLSTSTFTIGAGLLAGNPGTVTTGLSGITVGSGLSLSVAGTLTATGSGGSVTQVVVAAGPFLSGVTINIAGTITSSASTLTNHGVLIGQAASAPVATAVGTDGQILLGQSAADPTWATMSGDATVTKAGVFNLTSVVAAGTIGSASVVPIITFDTKGRIISTTTAAINAITSQVITQPWVGISPNNAVIYQAINAGTVDAVWGNAEILNGAAFTVQLVKSADGTAIASGVTLTTNTFNANTLAATNQTLTLTGTAGNLVLAVGDRLGLIASGTAGTAMVAALSVRIKP